MSSPIEESQKPQGTLTGEQADIIGEVSNISMGAAATALSNIIRQKVTITSPKVELLSDDNLAAIRRIPSVEVVVSYTAGISGSNMLVIREKDAAEIVRAMTGGMLDESEEGFGEMHLSAIGEVMNQMMGSSATALSGFIGRSVNISTPTAFMLTEENSEKSMEAFQGERELVLVRFLFTVEDTIHSDLFMLMTPGFARELVDRMMAKVGEPGPVAQQPSGEGASALDSRAAEAVRRAAPQTEVSARVVAAAAAASGVAAVRETAAAPSAAAVMQAAAAPARTAVRPVVLPTFDKPPDLLSPDEAANFSLIQQVPLELSVEVGRARKKVREVIDLSVGSIIELDKQAGDPVDIIVNGQLVAHGEVVVIDENFGVRVTEIVGK